MFDHADVDCPYPGLRPFEPYEGEIFFGREGHTDQLLEILQRERFLAVIGPSGGGKSSLVRAGLLPALAGGRLGTGSHWRLALLRPGSQPLLALAQALISPHALGPELLRQVPEQQAGPAAPLAPATAEQATSDAALIAAELRHGPDGFERVLEHAQVRRLSVKNAERDTISSSTTSSLPTLNLLVLVDQFEELFTYRAAAADPNESAHFVKLLLRAYGGSEGQRSESPHGDIRVVVALTMRADFLGDCVEFPDLPEAINRAVYLTPRLREQELHAAIVAPAQGFGGEVDESFVKATIGSAGTANDQLPLLQHALARWWREAASVNKDKPVIDLTSTRQAGSLHEALNRHADSLYDQMSAPEKLACEGLLRAITAGSDGGDAVRRPQRLADIASWSGVSEATLIDVVKALAAPEVSFLHHGSALNGDSTIDVTHEALMRHWILLKEWVASETRRGEGWQRWQSRAAEHAAGQGELLVGGDLARAMDWWNPSATSDNTPSWQPTASWARRYAEATSNPEEIARQLHQLRDYLVDSNAAVRRAQNAKKLVNRLLIGLLVVFLLALGVALWSSRRALTAERENLSTAKEAAVDGLIAAAERQLRQGNSDLAALLGINALAARPSSEPARSSLLLALDDLYTRFALTKHTGPVKFAISSADGATLITAGEDGEVLFWRASDGTQLSSVPKRGGAVTGLGASSDGDVVVVGYANGSLVFWDMRSMTIRREVQTAIQIGGLAISADGRAAVAWSASSGKVQIWSSESEMPITEFDAGAKPINDAVFVMNASFVATAHQDGLVRLWDATRGTHARSFPGHVGVVRRVYGSPDGKTLLSTSNDYTARTWNVQTGSQTCLFPGNKGAVTSADFSPDGKRIATAGADFTARVWNLADCKLSVDLRGHKDSIQSVAFSRDGRRIVTAGADFSAKVWNADHGTIVSDLKGHTKAVRVATFAGSAQYIFTGSDDGSARLWSVEKGESLARFTGFRERVVDITGGTPGAEVVAILGDGRLRKWARDGKGIDMSSPVKSIQAAALSADGGTAVAVGGSRRGGGATLAVWGTEIGRPANVHPIDSARSYAVSVSDDGSVIVVSTSDKRVRILRDQHMPLTSYFVKTDGSIRGVSISGDGKRLAANLSDHSVSVLDVATGREICALRDQKWPFSISQLSRDGKKAVTAGADGSAVVWSIGGTDSDTCRPIGTLFQTWTGGRLAVTSLRFDDDGSLLAIGNSDGGIKVWSAESLLQVADIKGHQSPIATLRFSADGKSLYSGSSDRSVRQWNIQRTEWHSEELLNFARSRLRNLDFHAARNDCERYFTVHFDPSSDFCANSRH